MNETLQLLLPFGYRQPTDKEVKEAKDYVLKRERTASALAAVIDALMITAAEQITRLAYQYDVDGMEFTISTSYNEKLFAAIAEILDRLDEEIMELVLLYSTMTAEKERNDKLLPWLVTLGSGNNNLQQTLDGRIWKFSRDLEAAIAAMRIAEVSQSLAINKIKSNLHAIYLMPEVRKAFRYSSKVKATYLQTKGVKHGDVGQSNSESNNIIRFAKTTLQMAWMRDLYNKYEEDDAAAFAVLRGSTYPCDLCDSHVGVWELSQTSHFPPFHPSCMCYAIPVFKEQY